MANYHPDICNSGLKIVMDIGQYEYLPEVGEAAGTVVVVHGTDQMPFPEDEGVVLPPGKLSMIGIKVVSFHP